jgi:prevent-host-death family protein
LQKIGSREFKNHMGNYLRAARAGQTFIITNRGKPIAKLTPPSDAEMNLQDRLRELESQGLLKLARKHLRRTRAVKNSGKPASQIIIKDRR